jgi:hypothetical protein
MIKPSFLVEVVDGKPTVSVVDTDADKPLQAYLKSDKEAYLFIRPSAEKRKKALAKPAAKPAAKAAKKAAKK